MCSVTCTGALNAGAAPPLVHATVWRLWAQRPKTLAVPRAQSQWHSVTPAQIKLTLPSYPPNPFADLLLPVRRSAPQVSVYRRLRA